MFAGVKLIQQWQAPIPSLNTDALTVVDEIDMLRQWRVGRREERALVRQQAPLLALGQLRVLPPVGMCV